MLSVYSRYPRAIERQVMDSMVDLQWLMRCHNNRAAMRYVRSNPVLQLTHPDCIDGSKGFVQQPQPCIAEKKSSEVHPPLLSR